MSNINFGSLMADMEASMASSSRSVNMWVPEFGWTVNEILASEAPFPPQLLAAYQTFMFLWNVIAPRVWVHIAAEMQAGKTGVISAVIRLVLSNKSLGITPHRIFVATGMSDEAWEKQTKKRMPECIRANVHHAGTISHIAAKLKSLAGENYLSNVLIFLDESHIATSSGNQPNIHIYRKVEELCPRSMWQERNIRFVTVSATDPAKVLAMKDADVPCEVVRLYTTEEYTSVQKLKDSGSIRYIERVGMLHSESGFNALMSAVRETEGNSGGPLIHIIRPRAKNLEEITAKLEATGARVISWNAKANSATRKGSDSVSSMSTDINDVLLADKPDQTTFIVLKDMFRAAKTIDTTHIGVLFDRLGTNDSTNLQSLLGRACGYGKSGSTIIFTSEKTVSTYINMWRELCSNKAFPTEVADIPITHVNKKMPHVKAVSSETGIKIGTTATHASPIGSGVGRIAGGAGIQRVGDENFEMEWFEDTSFDILKNKIREAGIPVAYMTLGKRKKLGEFYISDSAVKKKTRVISYADLMLIRDGKKTSHITGSHADKVIGREHGMKTLFIGYRNLDDPTSVVFAVKFAWRKF
jgi:hypothetical protein